MANLVSDIITEAFILLGVLQPGGSITTAMQTDAFLRLNQIWLSLGTDQGITNARYHQTLTVTAGTDAYTFGTGGTLVATAAPVKIEGAQSRSGNFIGNVRVMSFADFDVAVQSRLGERSILAQMLACDNSYPSINIRVFPMPDTSPGSLVLDYYGVMAAFSSVSQSLSLAPEFEQLLYTQLALMLYPQYSRVASTTAEFIAGLAAAALSTVRAKNQIGGAPAAPQAA